ncbi:MAM and LDL-receptor class A domain-containing protein 1-like isoform X1 [Montipora foliosa]|uniref:MAM and LDL-receptor class A domain-containing protein 1-like isoform X1 n=1 Tax=Montipora foliosa TaxID=591990 RepID=UPI0035F10889
MILSFLLLLVSLALVAGLECNFDGKELCGRVSQSKDDDFDWTLRKGTTPSSGTGPIADVSGNGYYAYIEASSPRKQGDNAQMVFKPGLISGETCISFRYHMLGESVGKLKVWVDGIVRFEKSGNQGREWMKADLKLEKPTDANTLYIFEGIVGKNWQGDIAIDDVKILSCERAGDEIEEGGCGLECNFDGEEKLCDRVSQSKDDDFDWTLRKGTTPSSGTGPSADVSGNGYYAYIEASRPRKRGDNARMVFKPGLISGETCISFRYHMLGRGVGKLKVWVDGIVRFEKSGYQGREWMKADLKLEKPTDANTLYIFEGIVGKNWQGDIAIDDVKILSCGGAGEEIEEGGCGPPEPSSPPSLPPLPPSNPPPPLPPSVAPASGCGIRPSTRIVGGMEARVGDWPWQGMLRNNYGFPFCGGTLVARLWLVTAAHCVQGSDPSSVLVRLGAHKRTSNLGNEQDFKVVKIISHPLYQTEKGYSHDIALLKLDKPAKLNRFVNLACLPQNVDAPTNNVRCWITGWGRNSSGGHRPEILHQASVPIASRARCDRAYPGLIHDSMICAGLDQGGVDACQGDSGGPMVCETAGKYYLQGATSWGFGCASPGKFGVYAKVKYLLKWINEEMAKN